MTFSVESADQQSLDDPLLYANRELSWLDFNDRVLAEAYDPRNPLLERVRFLSITASNLDEFYSKRIAWLRQMLATDATHRTVDGLTIAEQLEAILKRCTVSRREMESCWHDVLEPSLAEAGIRVVRFGSLDAEAHEKLRRYFVDSVYPVLTPLVVDPAHPFPFISSASVSLLLSVREPHTGRERTARVKVPPNRPRFIDAGDGRFILLEDLIVAHLDMLFPGVQVLDVHLLRVLRSIELGTTGEAADDLLELVEAEVRRRRLADAVGVEITGVISYDAEQQLLRELQLRPADMITCRGPLGLADLTQLAALPLADHLYQPFTPTVPTAFILATDDGPSLFDRIRAQDILVHHPYESFDATVARFISDAANDPSVLAIKQTLYRTSPDSPLLLSLLDASMKGKQVAVLVELTARLDEENNIEWARRLEEAGVHVAYGNPSQKIHSKISLVVREEPTGVQLYAHIGSGNYNSRTARFYTDVGLLTSDPVICLDLLRVFNHLTGISEDLEPTRLLVAPMSLRDGLEARVRREIEHARAGRHARIVFKMNALEDYQFTKLLYEASQAGVQVDLVVRGICRVRPGIPGLSENIRVVSVLGRFLEHARMFYFLNDGASECMIGSADIMKRNLDERTEVLVPVIEPQLQERLIELLELQLHDERQGWRLQDRRWTRHNSCTQTGSQSQLLAMAPFS